MDLYPAHDMYDGFCNYQKALLSQFDELRVEYGFETIDASPEPKIVFAMLKAKILDLLDSPRKAYLTKQVEETIERLTRTIEARANFILPAGSQDVVPTLQPVARVLGGNGNGHH